MVDHLAGIVEGRLPHVPEPGHPGSVDNEQPVLGDLVETAEIAEGPVVGVHE
jgi:hypothetical protein